MVKVSRAFILYFMNYLLNWAVCSCSLLSFVFNDIVSNLYFKIVLILLFLEAGDIELNLDTILQIALFLFYTAILEAYVIS